MCVHWSQIQVKIWNRYALVLETKGCAYFGEFLRIMPTSIRFEPKMKGTFTVRSIHTVTLGTKELN